MDDRILGKKEAADWAGVSERTLDRLGPEGPPRIRLSKRRIGYRPKDLVAWANARAEPKSAA
jgi:hypothetical protein